MCLGGGCTGATHSHNPEFPDDNWNLYAMIEAETTTALNVTRPTDAVGKNSIMYACICICMYVYMHIYAYDYIFIFMYMYISIFMYLQ
jgi:hypothetical protein